MTEEEKIKIAKTYITKLANGINPLDDMIIPESDIINNVHISRCLFYVADILEEMTDDKTEIQKGEFYISDEDIQKFTYSETPLTLTKIIKKNKCHKYKQKCQKNKKPCCHQPAYRFRIALFKD